MLKYLFIVLVLPIVSYAQKANWETEKIKVIKDDNSNIVMDATALYNDEWVNLPQPQFWRQIMKLAPDSCLINTAASRIVLAKMSYKDWNAQTEIRKEFVRDSLRIAYNLDSNERIFVTTGKNDFYRFNDVYPTISKGVEVFESVGVDPWYAQAILLIESPGQLKKSSTGAYGAFQLMPSVARAMGLIVNNTIDERKDFVKSAQGSALLLKRVCIPEAKKILNAHNLSYNENDIWFRLFVLHVYHAGAINVRAVVNKINPENGSQDLIKKMWQTTAASFGNNSQNYTQLALASQIILNELIYESGAIIECASISNSKEELNKN